MKVFLIISILIFQGCAGTNKKEVSIKQNEEVVEKSVEKESSPPVPQLKKIETAITPQESIKENINEPLPEAAPKEEVSIKQNEEVVEKSVEKESSLPVPQLKKIEAAIIPQESINEPLSKAAPKVDLSEVNPKPLSKEKPLAPKQAKESELDDHKVDSKDVVTVTIPNKNVKGTSLFSPEVLRIKVGQKVMWVNEDDRTHFINKKPEFNAKSLRSYGEDDEDEDEETTKIKKNGTGFSNSPLMPKGKKWIFQFKEEGTISYYCFTHPLEMRGKIIVE